jgi:hypothetical protein
MSMNKIGIKLLFITFSKSLKSVRKSRVPRIEPCGKPHLTFAMLEKENLYVSLCREYSLISVVKV